MINLQKNVKVEDIISCPSLAVCFICETEEQRELVKKYNERVKEKTMEKKANKFLYGWNIWTNYGYGWEIESSYYKHESTYKDVLHDAKEYRIAGAKVRVTNTRTLNPSWED